MDLIYDRDGVDVIIPPVEGLDGFQVNLDFNFSKIKLHQLCNHSHSWDLHVRHHGNTIGKAKFTAYQFFADGVERRTIALQHLEVFPEHRGQKKSYDIMRYILETVEIWCDSEWNEAYGDPVIFVEKRDMKHIPEHDREGVFAFLKKVAEAVYGHEEDRHQHIPNTDLVVTAIGPDVSMQLIQGHLERSASEENRA